MTLWQGLKNVPCVCRWVMITNSSFRGMVRAEVRLQRVWQAMAVKTMATASRENCAVGECGWKGCLETRTTEDACIQRGRSHWWRERLKGGREGGICRPSRNSGLSPYFRQSASVVWSLPYFFFACYLIWRESSRKSGNYWVRCPSSTKNLLIISYSFTE